MEATWHWTTISAATTQISCRLQPATHKGRLFRVRDRPYVTATLCIESIPDFVRSPSRVRIRTPSGAVGIDQILQKLFRRDQIGGVETLRKAVVDRLEAGDGIGRSDLIAQQPGEARRGAQLP
jgi:hypothetical protein